MSTPTHEPNPFGYDGSPGEPGQAPLPGQLGYPGQAGGAPGPGFPAAPGFGDTGVGAIPPYPGPGPQYGYAPPRPTVTSSVAVVAICLFWVPLVGLVLSIIGMVKTAKGKARGRGMAITALVLSILVTLGAGAVAGIIASKPSALDPGCTHGKLAITEQSKQLNADREKGDEAALQADFTRVVELLGKAADESHRSDVRSAMQAVRDDYAGFQAGNGDATKLTVDLQQIDHLCTYGK